MRSLRVALIVLAGSALGAGPAAAEFKPMDLPGPGARAAAAANGQWLLGVRGERGHRLARAAGARDVVPGAVRVRAREARRVAGVLRRRGLLTFAQADVRVGRQSAYDGREGEWARGAVAPPPAQLAVPAPGPSIAVIDDPVDGSHPDVGPTTRFLNRVPVTDSHGTMVASAAAGLAQGTGVTGLYPGAPILSWGTDLSCSDIARGVETARRAGAAVINLSLGGPEECLPITIAVQRAIADGKVVVAASGNEFAEGNPVIYPAASPHVLSVAAVDQQLRATAFSTANAAVDVAAPGKDVPLAIPVALDTDDGARDGVTTSDGTSFSAPIVSGLAAWLVAVRPGLDAIQYGDLIRGSATDLGGQGYDRDTGFGLVSLPAALAARTPARDVLEPNDGITYVDGTLFGSPDRPVSTGRSRTITAPVDLVEDPVDVYRIRVPRGARMSVVLRPIAGQVDLAVYDGSADTLEDEPIDVSARGGTRTDSVRFRNSSRRTRTAYVAVAPSQRATSLNARYRLHIKRLRR